MRITVLGVPESVGTYAAGVERAPAALRSAGLIDALAAAGNDVHDAGDVTERRWRPDRAQPYAQNADEVAASIRELRDAGATLLAHGERLLVLGGGCTVAVGVCAAMAAAGERPRLVYIDRHLDLNTPSSTTEGSLSWMGMAHALALEGAVDVVVAAAGPSPLLAPGDLVYLGSDVTAETTDGERSAVDALGITVVSQAELVAQPADAARRARRALGPGPFVIHLDVDVLDFLDAPIAENVNGRNAGPSLAGLQPALVELWRDPACLGLSIGQLDPGHAEGDPTAIPRLIDVLAAAAQA